MRTSRSTRYTGAIPEVMSPRIGNEIYIVLPEYNYTSVSPPCSRALSLRSLTSRRGAFSETLAPCRRGPPLGKLMLSLFPAVSHTPVKSHQKRSAWTLRTVTANGCSCEAHIPRVPERLIIGFIVICARMELKFHLILWNVKTRVWKRFRSAWLSCLFMSELLSVA